MEYKGIRYDIRIAPAPNEWVWVVHLPHEKQGSVKGTRGRAELAAKDAIDVFCREHPGDCDPLFKN
jgi:hypothetical protein